MQMELGKLLRNSFQCNQRINFREPPIPTLLKIPKIALICPKHPNTPTLTLGSSELIPESSVPHPSRSKYPPWEFETIKNGKVLYYLEDLGSNSIPTKISAFWDQFVRPKGLFDHMVFRLKLNLFRLDPNLDCLIRIFLAQRSILNNQNSFKCC